MTYPSKIQNEVFDQNRHDHFDIPARRAVVKFLSQHFLVWENPQKYGVDCLLLDGEILRVVEIGRKNPKNWSGETEFQYPTIHIPERKKKFAALANSVFFETSYNLSQAFMTTGEKVLQSSVVRVYGISYFDVPVQYGSFIHLNSNRRITL